MSTEADYTVKIKRFDPEDVRLGRHVLHDSRSRAFAYPRAADPTKLQSIRHTSATPTMDQGQLGSCTGNSGTKVLTYAPFWFGAITNLLSTSDEPQNQRYAVGVYSETTGIDPFPGTYPPTDTGSNGLSTAKTMQKRGHISGYQHAFSLEAALNALAKQPISVGTVWRSDMFYVMNGRIRITGSDSGGHQYTLDELDVPNRRVWIQNSWGDGWGMQGRAYLTWDDLGELLAADGDATIYVPNTAPAPEPEPVPVPDVVATDEVTEQFIVAAEKWLGRPPFFYKSFQSDLRKYIEHLKG